jgi:lipopolysaccharide heptosyltransferase II
MKILLIRLRLVGDVVFTTPAIGAIRRQFPDARVSYLVEAAAAPVVAGHPDLDEVIVVAHHRGWRRVADDVALARRLRRERFDLVVDFHGGPRSAWLTWASGAPRRIGYVIRGRTWMYSDSVPRPRELRPRHSVENQWDLLGPLGVAQPDPAREPVAMADDAAARRRAESKLAAADVRASEPIIVVHVSAGNPFRRWPGASFAELAARLVRADASRRILFTSGPSDAGAARTVADLTRTALGPALQDRIVRCEELDLPELRAAIARAALFIGGDSGPLHVAATTGTPVVAIFGPTLAARSSPWRSPTLVTETLEPGSLPCRPCDQRRCRPGDFRCLTSISSAAVAAAAERALERAASARSPAGALKAAG